MESSAYLKTKAGNFLRVVSAAEGKIDFVKRIYKL